MNFEKIIKLPKNVKKLHSNNPRNFLLKSTKLLIKTTYKSKDATESIYIQFTITIVTKPKSLWLNNPVKLYIHF